MEKILTVTASEVRADPSEASTLFEQLLAVIPPYQNMSTATTTTDTTTIPRLTPLHLVLNLLIYVYALVGDVLAQHADEALLQAAVVRACLQHPDLASEGILSNAVEVHDQMNEGNDVEIRSKQRRLEVEYLVQEFFESLHGIGRARAVQCPAYTYAAVGVAVTFSFLTHVSFLTSHHHYTAT